MIDIIKREYWSKADAFVLPLVGIDKNCEYNIKSFFFWQNYSIDNYHLIVMFEHDNIFKLNEYIRNNVFPVLDKKGYLIESHDINESQTILILDLSEWALDIDLILNGKYSRLSEQARSCIEDYHMYDGNLVPIHIYSVLYPTDKLKILDYKNSIDFISEFYGFQKDDMYKIGEIGSKYDKMSETLIISSDDLADL
jgi:hypothetical protein